MRESEIEKKVVAIAEKSGWLSRKFTSPSRRAVPDRLFVKDGAVVLVEFKAPGKKPTLQQTREHGRLAAHGLPVYVVDSVEDGRDLFED